MNIVWEELTRGFADGEQLIRVLVRLFVAVVLGSIIGFKRERDGKAAGLRTHIIVSLGSALFVLSLIETGATAGEVTRVVQGIATGIGFVGAGCIVKPRSIGPDDTVRGLTTAADIWLTAAVGVAAGLGNPAIGVVGMTLTMITLNVFRRKDAPRRAAATQDPPAEETSDTWEHY